MKKAYYAIVGFAMLIVGQMSAQTPETETKGGLIIEWWSASLPRESSPKGASWNVASSNWMQMIQKEQVNLDSGRTGVQKISFCDYAGMITTSTINSWRGVAEEGTGEYGNRQPFGFKVFSANNSSVVSFVPSQITYTISSEKFDSGSKKWVSEFYTDVTSSMGINNNSFRLSLKAGSDGVLGNSDDVLSDSQLMTNPTSCFIYGGYGIGFLCADQSDMNNSIQYLSSNKFRINITVTVPVIGGSVQTFSKIYMPPPQDVSNLAVNYFPPVGGGSANVVISSGNSAWLYEIESSPDISTWTSAGYFWGESGNIPVPVSEQKNSNPKYFYRVKAW